LHWAERGLLIAGDAIASWPELSPGWKPFTLNERRHRASLRRLAELEPASSESATETPSPTEHENGYTSSRRSDRRSERHAMSVEEREARTLTALTTEHFTLQGTRAAMTTESLGRATIYLGSLSATLVVLALVSQGANSPAEFRIFALAILPAIVFLGVATFVRIVETAIEDNIAAMGINRIRGYYLELAGEEARRYFALGPHDDREGVLANAGLNSTWGSRASSTASRP